MLVLSHVSIFVTLSLCLVVCLESGFRLCVYVSRYILIVARPMCVLCLKVEGGGGGKGGGSIFLL